MGYSMNQNIEGLKVTRLKEIVTQGGNVFHGMKINDPGYVGFGEAYFSRIEARAIKPWKRHRKLTLNIVVPVGTIRFVVFDDRDESKTQGIFQEIILSQNNYCRLTVPPMLWMAFQCVENEFGLLLNIADMPHDPLESDRKKLEEILFSW